METGPFGVDQRRMAGRMSTRHGVSVDATPSDDGGLTLSKVSTGSERRGSGDGRRGLRVLRRWRGRRRSRWMVVQSKTTIGGARSEEREREREKEDGFALEVESLVFGRGDDR